MSLWITALPWTSSSSVTSCGFTRSPHAPLLIKGSWEGRYSLVPPEFPPQWPRQTRRPACAGKTNLASIEFRDRATCRLKPGPGLWITGNHNNPSRRHGEHIAAEGIVFLTWNLDHLDTPVLQQFKKWNRQ